MKYKAEVCWEEFLVVKWENLLLQLIMQLKNEAAWKVGDANPVWAMLKYLHGIATIHKSVNDIWSDQRSLDRSRLNWYRPIGVKKIRVDTN